MIIADTTEPNGRQGVLIAIPWAEVRAAMALGRSIMYHDPEKPFDVTIMFGETHDEMIATIKAHAISVEGEEPS